MRSLHSLFPSACVFVASEANEYEQCSFSKWKNGSGAQCFLYLFWLRSFCSRGVANTQHTRNYICKCEHFAELSNFRPENVSFSNGKSKSTVKFFFPVLVNVNGVFRNWKFHLSLGALSQVRKNGVSKRSFKMYFMWDHRRITTSDTYGSASNVCGGKRVSHKCWYKHSTCEFVTFFFKTLLPLPTF